MDASATGQPPERSRSEAEASLGNAEKVKEGAPILNQCLQWVTLPGENSPYA
jgi:hypothetical protein